MFFISFAIFSLLFFLLAATNTAAEEQISTTTVSPPNPSNLPNPDCYSTCRILALPNESGHSLFSKLCGVAVPDESCTKFGQLETRVKFSGAGSQDTILKCLCSSNGDWQEISRSEVPAETTGIYKPSQIPASTAQAQPAAPPPRKTSTDTKLNSHTSSTEPDRKISLSPAAAAGISVASLVSLLILVVVGLLAWRRHVKTRDHEPDFESVWDGQKFPRNIPVLGKRFK